MSKLVSALTSGDARTANGAITNSTTDSALLDLFAVIGSLRGRSEQEIINLWVKAFNENKKFALQMLLWVRDCRGGAGERRTFRIIYSYLKANQPEYAILITQKLAEVGRWDDLWKSGPLSDYEKELIKSNLNNNLLCKWIPRREKVFYELAKFCGMSYSVFRKTIVGNSTTVEQLMSSNSWGKVNYPAVPSKAMSIYADAFKKHDQKRFDDFITKVQKGEAKINASTLFPHDLIKQYYYGKQESVIVEQWKALPKYSTKNENILVVADVSGSMTISTGSVRPIDASVALALYTCEHNTGIFKDCFITFSSNPSIQKVKGTFTERVKQINSAEWGMSTNLQAVFDLILSQGKKHNLSQEDMPTKIIIISDMEFNKCVANSNSTNFDSCKKKYKESNFIMPTLIFWNVNGRTGNNPIKTTDRAVLISGYSPAIIPSILGESIDPIEVMLKTINKERYLINL